MPEKLKNIPWTPVLLLALLISNCANWVELRHVQRKSEEWGWDNHYVQSSTNTTVDAMNERLKEISDNTDCLKLIRPAWCKP
jgi:hypothetical protein